MIVANGILVNSKGNTIGAEFYIDGQYVRYSTEQLKRTNISIDNAIIDKNGHIRAKKRSNT